MSHPHGLATPTDPLSPAATDSAPAPLVQVSSGLTSLLASLPTRQRQVLLRLANGASIANAAFGCGVCRMTVYRWIKQEGPFRTAYNCWRRELIESSQSRLLQLLDEAVDAVQIALTDGKVDVAMELLKTMGALRKPKLGRPGPLLSPVDRQAAAGIAVPNPGCLADGSGGQSPGNEASHAPSDSTTGA